MASSCSTFGDRDKIGSWKDGRSDRCRGKRPRKSHASKSSQKPLNRRKPAAPRASQDVSPAFAEFRPVRCALGPRRQGVEAKRAEARARHYAVWGVGSA